MGVFNNGAFHPLKEYGEKLVRFKMAVSQKAAEDAGMIDADHLKCIVGGACAGYVLAWIAQQLGGPVAFHGGGGARTKDDALSRQTAAAVAPHYAEYTRNPNQRAGLHQLADRYGLTLCAENKRLTVRPLLTLFTDVQYKIKAGQMYFISAAVIGDKKTEAHALGMSKDANNDLHFFDPNIGEYRLTAPHNFFPKYVALVETNLKWKYGEASADRVGKSTPVASLDIDDLMASL